MLLVYYSNLEGQVYNGTGFIGEIKIKSENRIVLVTNYHVMIGDSAECKNATEVTTQMKRDIESNARNSRIILERKEKEIKLSGEVLVEDSSIMSPRKTVCITYSVYTYIQYLYVLVSLFI